MNAEHVGSARPILRLLRRMRAAGPTLRIVARAVRAFALRAVHEAARYSTLGDAVREYTRRDDADSRLISELLREEYEDCLEPRRDDTKLT